MGIPLCLTLQAGWALTGLIQARTTKLSLTCYLAKGTCPIISTKMGKATNTSTPLQPKRKPTTRVHQPTIMMMGTAISEATVVWGQLPSPTQLSTPKNRLKLAHTISMSPHSKESTMGWGKLSSSAIAIACSRQGPNITMSTIFHLASISLGPRAYLIQPPF